jgi:molybdenum cofactor synthesis domain-containing protein
VGSAKKPHTVRRTIHRPERKRARRPRRPPLAPVPKVVPERSGPLHVELISVGRELLKGRVRDFNGPHLADHFTEQGAVVHRITVVDDTERAIASAVREALDRRPHLVVTTGGLGPASDDRTLAAVAEALQLPLRRDPRVRRMIEQAYERLRARGLVEKTGLTAARDKACSIPVGAEPIPNAIGIAPGVWIRLTGGAAVLCLPGEPAEMRAVLAAAAPALKGLAPRRHRAVREVEAPTADESSLQPLIEKLSAEYPMVWVKSHAPGLEREDARVMLSLEASSPRREEAESAVEGALQRLLALAAGVN